MSTVRLQAVGKALGVNYRLNKQCLGGSAIARHLTANH